MRQALESQFAIVYSAGNAKQLRFATYLANLLQMTGDSVVRILSDREPMSGFKASLDNAIFIGGTATSTLFWDPYARISRHSTPSPHRAALTSV